MTPCKTVVFGSLLCGEPATNVVAAGCVHEHVETDPICRRHLEGLLAGNLRCPNCWRSSDRHHCVVIGRVMA